MGEEPTVNPHDGGPCPLPDDLIVRPQYRGDERPEIGTRIRVARAARLDWSHEMTVAELIGQLKQLPSDAPVYRDGGEYKDHHQRVHTVKLFKAWGLEGVLLE